LVDTYLIEHFVWFNGGEIRRKSHINSSLRKTLLTSCQRCQQCWDIKKTTLFVKIIQAWMAFKTILRCVSSPEMCELVKTRIYK